MFLVLNKTIPHVDNLGNWTNAEYFFMKPNPSNVLEFELLSPLSEEKITRVDKILRLEPGESTYEDESFIYHIEFLEVF